MASELSRTPKNPRTRLGQLDSDPPDHPLTARVMVNRIWQYHFGRGIVATPNDFGRMGQRPSAIRNCSITWRIVSSTAAGAGSRLHRMILLSSTYRQSSRSPMRASAVEKDPDNRLLWKFPRRRLEAEEIRDAMLAVSGRLNLKAGGPSVMVPVDQELVELALQAVAVGGDARRRGARSPQRLSGRQAQSAAAVHGSLRSRRTCRSVAPAASRARMRRRRWNC